MKKLTREDIIEIATSQGLLPPFNHQDEKTAINVLGAIYEGGLRIIEFTNRSGNALEVFKALVKYRNRHLPDLVLGIGTIMNLKQAKQFYKAGAQFIVAPTLSKSVGAFCSKNELLWIPGAATPTEIIQASEWGAGIVKLFPADTLGISFIKAFRGPCPQVKLMPSGGVTMEKENIREWFAAGVVCIAIGSQLFSKEIMQDGNFELLKQRIAGLLETIREVKNEN